MNVSRDFHGKRMVSINFFNSCTFSEAINRYFESRKKLYTMMLDKSYEEIKAQNRRRARKHQVISYYLR